MNVRPYGCLTFIFYQRYFYGKMDLKLFYLHVAIYCQQFSSHFLLAVQDVDKNQLEVFVNSVD